MSQQEPFICIGGFSKQECRDRYNRSDSDCIEIYMHPCIDCELCKIYDEEVKVDD